MAGDDAQEARLPGMRARDRICAPRAGCRIRATALLALLGGCSPPGAEVTPALKIARLEKVIDIQGNLITDLEELRSVAHAHATSSSCEEAVRKIIAAGETRNGSPASGEVRRQGKGQ